MNFSHLSQFSQAVDRVAFANILRGFAAICVVISHYYGVFWLNQSAVSSLTHLQPLNLDQTSLPPFIFWLNSIPYFNWGAYGVALFFLISGFVIPFSLKKSTWAGFLVNRFFRIFPTYMVGFSLTLLMIWYGLNYFSLPWPFSISEIIIHYIPGIRDIMISRNIDGIIWTLEIELKFYLFCALGYPLFNFQSKKVFLLPLILLAAAWALINSNDYLVFILPKCVPLSQSIIFCAPFIVYMFIGVAFHYLYINKISLRLFFAIVVYLWVIFSIMWYLGPSKPILHLMWSYFFSLLTFALAFRFRSVMKEYPVVKFFASISYPLYVIHGVAGYVVMQLLLGNSFSILTTLFLVTLGAISLSWIIHITVEYPTQKMGKSLSKLNFCRTKFPHHKEVTVS